MPRISVCLPVFNGERYLAAAIESVLAQTYTDFELLIADDCSSDNSLEIAQSYADKDQRIVVWRNEANQGLFNNYNVCIKRAAGEYIKLFAQDDVLHSTMLEKELAVLSNDPSIRLVSSGKNWIGDDGAVIKKVHPFDSNQLLSGKEVIRFNLIQLNNWVGEPSTVMFRKANIDTGFDARFYHYGDIEYWFRIIEGGNYYYLNETLCSFRRHSHSSTTANLSGMFFALDILLLGEKYGHYTEELGESKEHFLRRALERIALNVDHLVRNEGLTAESSVATRAGSKEQREAQSDGFKELSFQALRYITSLIAEYDALRCRTADEQQQLNDQLQNMKDSTSWKLTAPLRQLTRHRGT